VSSSGGRLAAAAGTIRAAQPARNFRNGGARHPVFYGDSKAAAIRVGKKERVMFNIHRGGDRIGAGAQAVA